MAVVTRANDGKYFMTYEMVSMPGYSLEPRTNPVYFKVSDDGVNWGDPKGHAMIALGDGREILQFVNVDGRIQYAKFKLPERLPKYPWPFGPRKPGQ